MIESLELINFKPFKNQLLKFRPLTLLTGINSTGKSSVLQSLLLLRQSYQQGLLEKNNLALNGNLVCIGTAKDALFEGAQEYSIKFNIIWKWINNRIQSTLNNGEELWSRKQELFPNLEFCDSVKQQIYGFANGNIMLLQVLKRLRELENYCENWTTGSFDFNKIPSKISSESDSRKRKFKEQLTFQCPDGNKHLFSYHARMTPGAWRLHFHPEAQSRKIIIGYIGIKIQ